MVIYPTGVCETSDVVVLGVPCSVALALSLIPVISPMYVLLHSFLLSLPGPLVHKEV